MLDIDHQRDVGVRRPELGHGEVDVAAARRPHVVGPAGHRRTSETHDVGRRDRVRAGVDGGQSGVANGDVVAVAIAGVEGDDHVGAQLLDDGLDLRRQQGRIDQDQCARRWLARHPRVDVAEQANQSDAQDPGRGSELGLP
jgi:hypothetical protein